MTMLPAMLKRAGYLPFPSGLFINSSQQPHYHSRLRYATHHIGKWHAGFASRSGNIPVARGFDTSLGYFHGAEDHYTQSVAGNIKCKGHTEFTDLWLNDGPASGINGSDYSMHIYRDRALNLLNEHDVSQPLFLFLAWDNNHAPLQVH